MKFLKTKLLIFKYLAILLLFSMIISFTSCDVPPTAGHGTPKEDFPLFTMVAVSVVGGESVGYVIRMEEDEYGRIFFEFCVGNLLGWYYDHGIDGYGICQKIEDGYAYYYEDFCYVGAQSLEDIDSEAVEELKEINDWGKEPNNTKVLSKVKSFEKHYETNFFNISNKEEENAAKHFESIEGVSRKDFEDFDVYHSCRDSNGKTLFYIALSKKFLEEGGPDSSESEIYAIIIDTDGSASETSILKIDDPYNCRNELRDFKLRNGWKPFT